MSAHLFRFVDVWDVDVPADAIISRLSDLERYPQWWWGFRTARRLDEDTVEFTVRSRLPYTLVLRQRFEERGERHALVRVDGDLAGRLALEVSSVGPGRSRTEFTLEVEVTRPLLRVFAPIARPAYRMNHNAVMRAGLAYLRR